MPTLRQTGSAFLRGRGTIGRGASATTGGGAAGTGASSLRDGRSESRASFALSLSERIEPKVRA